MNIIYDIADYLADNGIGTLGTDIFIGSLSSDLENGIMLVSTSSGSNRMDYPVFETNIEIWTRNKTTSAGFNKLNDILNLLHLKENITTHNAYIYFIHSPNGVESIGRDVDGRALHKMLINVTYRDPLIS